MSHYFAEEMFAKVLVSPTLPYPYNTLKVSIVSDHLQHLNVELMVKIQRWDQLDSYFAQYKTIQISGQSVHDMELDMLELQRQGHCYESNSTIIRFDYCFLTFE